MQTSVVNEFPVGVEGAVADASDSSIVSRAVETEAGIPYGRFVTKGTEDNQCDLPNASGDITAAGLLLGVTLWIPGRAPDIDGVTTGYGEKDTTPVLRKGLVWMVAEDAVDYGGAVYVRHVAGASEELGRVRSDGDSGDAAVAPACFFRSTTTGTDELVLVEVNLP